MNTTAESGRSSISSLLALYFHENADRVLEGLDSMRALVAQNPDEFLLFARYRILGVMRNECPQDSAGQAGIYLGVTACQETLTDESKIRRKYEEVFGGTLPALQLEAETAILEYVFATARTSPDNFWECARRLGFKRLNIERPSCPNEQALNTALNKIFNGNITNLARTAVQILTEITAHGVAVADKFGSERWQRDLSLCLLRIQFGSEVMEREVYATNILRRAVATSVATGIDALIQTLGEKDHSLRHPLLLAQEALLDIFDKNFSKYSRLTEKEYQLLASLIYLCATIPLTAICATSNQELGRALKEHLKKLEEIKKTFSEIGFDFSDIETVPPNDPR